MIAPAKASYYHREPHTLSGPPPVIAFGGSPYPTNQSNFATWLFDPQGLYRDFSATHMPFLEGGLESTLNSNIHYDYESLTSGRSQLETPPRLAESDELISEFRRKEIIRWFQTFRRRQPKWEPLIANLTHESGDDLPALHLEMMHDCLHEFWESVSPRLPIVHQPTFPCNRCSVFLLMIMLALGAASLRGRDSTRNLSDYGNFADFIIDCVRWEILVQEEASPPVSLWVAQSLLLLEFYEKMYSSRRLHERAHIYHTPTLTLLRRGSPLIGRSGSESPPEEHASTDSLNAVGVDSRTAWTRWADTEAMHRVVFAAFMMDILHAAMFGHAADMAPHEIRLPLPCDDNLWTAQTPEAARQLESNLRMYGIRSVSFLDGLKKALHGKEVSTLSFGRMIIMSGLLSVGWHLSHRETHLRWLNLTTPSTETRDNWKQLLLRAFDNWKESFDAAQGSTGSPGHGAASGTADDGRAASSSPSFNGPIQSAAVLYHLAHISLHVDIVDCQVYAGAKRLLGRRVSTRDLANVASRMEAWARLPSTRHAVLHAFKLLHRVLVDPRRNQLLVQHQQHLHQHQHQHQYHHPHQHQHHHGHHLHHQHQHQQQHHPWPAEPDPHRPWIVYYAALCIWSFVMALRKSPPPHVAGARGAAAHHPSTAAAAGGGGVAAYLSAVAGLSELGEPVAATLADGLAELLDALRGVLAGAHWELLQEARERLGVCRDMLVGGEG